MRPYLLAGEWRGGATPLAVTDPFTGEVIDEVPMCTWAEMDEAAWTERLEEWRQLKPAGTGDGAKTTETASVLTGTTDTLTKTPPDTAKTTARRAALGLN